jgi:hypothetical protein
LDERQLNDLARLQVPSVDADDATARQHFQDEVLPSERHLERLRPFGHPLLNAHPADLYRFGLDPHSLFP